MNDRALKVLEQYELEIISTRRGRGSYIFETPQGLRILCEYTGSERKALFQNCLMQKIRDGGYDSIDLILPNREGSLISEDWEGRRYVLKEWYPGRECDTASETEILLAVGNLARLHCLMHLDDGEYRQTFAAAAPLQSMRRQNAELKKIRTFIRKKNDKGAFERLFLESYTQYYEQAYEAEKQLLGMEAQLNRMCAGNKSGICHGDYNHHHILLSGYEVATTNFECCRYDIQINDLYFFLRKIMEKQSWNPRLGMRMIDQYARIRPIPAEERRLLHIRLLYPEKFYKLANHYYGSSKAWISGRFLEKLEQQNRQQKERCAFIRLLE